MVTHQHARSCLTSAIFVFKPDILLHLGAIPPALETGPIAFQASCPPHDYPTIKCTRRHRDALASLDGPRARMDDKLIVREIFSLEGQRRSGDQTVASGWRHRAIDCLTFGRSRGRILAQKTTHREPLIRRIEPLEYGRIVRDRGDP